MKPTKACLNDVNGYGISTDYYLEGTQPTESCNMHRTIRLCSKSRKLPTDACKTVKSYGTIYLPEGHPLRYADYNEVIKYFKGASTDKASATIGVCDVCKGGGSAANQEALAAATQTANGLLTQAEALLSSGNLTSKQYDKLEDLRSPHPAGGE